MTGPAGWLFQNYTSTTYHHEMGHIWGATDEYHPDAAQSPTLLVGYTQEVNANSQYNDGTGYFGGAGESIIALMINNVDYVSPWTRGQWGTWDLDGDGIYDPQDTFPTVVLNTPTGSSTLAFTGTASVTPLKKETGTFADANIIVSRIARVEWRVNGGPWQAATASDGAFDESSEDFTFTISDLRDGGYVFEARATDHFGNATTRYPRRDVPCPAADHQQPADGGPRGDAGPRLERPRSSSTPPDRSTRRTGPPFSTAGIWRTTAPGTRLLATTTASHIVRHGGSEDGQGGGPGQRRRDRDPDGELHRVGLDGRPHSHVHRGPGAGFVTSPAVFNFDASGVSDGEDAATALQVRWDFEDDGIWDTGYSTTKDGLQRLRPGLRGRPRGRVRTTYLYGGNAVTATRRASSPPRPRRQSRALPDALQRHHPGGTVTVGIRTSLTGPCLTSLTRNQTELAEGDWNLFDLPDVAVTTGVTYYLVVLSSDTDMMWLADTSNPYAGGTHWYSTTWRHDLGPARRRPHFRIYDGRSHGPADQVPGLARPHGGPGRVRPDAPAVRDIGTNAYDHAPTVSLDAVPTSGTTSTTFDLTATGGDADPGTIWDGMIHYRWDVDGDGNFETEFGAANTRSATYARSGNYQATVEVRDRYHATARASVTLTVASGLPARRVDQRRHGHRGERGHDDGGLHRLPLGGERADGHGGLRHRQRDRHGRRLPTTSPPRER